MNENFQVSFHKDNNGDWFSRVTRFYENGITGYDSEGAFYGAFIGTKEECYHINAVLWSNSTKLPVDIQDYYPGGPKSGQLSDLLKVEPKGFPFTALGIVEY